MTVFLLVVENPHVSPLTLGTFTRQDIKHYFFLFFYSFYSLPYICLKFVYLGFQFVVKCYKSRPPNRQVTMQLSTLS